MSCTYPEIHTSHILWARRTCGSIAGTSMKRRSRRGGERVAGLRWAASGPRRDPQPCREGSRDRGHSEPRNCYSEVMAVKTRSYFLPGSDVWGKPEQGTEMGGSICWACTDCMLIISHTVSIHKPSEAKILIPFFFWLLKNFLFITFCILMCFLPFPNISLGHF